MLSLARLATVLPFLPTAFAIWPAPRSASLGDRYLYINQNIEISYNGETVCWNTSSPYPCPAAASADPNPGLLLQLTYTAGYSPTSLTSQQVVQAGVSRALDTIFQTKFVPWMLRPRGELAQHEPDVNKGQQPTLKSLRITQTGTDGSGAFKPLAGEVDESYNLTVSACGTASLSAVSSYGILHGLQSFTQLFFQHSTGTAWYTPYAPVSIQDAPKYVHRGAILDVARNYFPVSDILRTIDGLAWNKMNRYELKTFYPEVRGACLLTRCCCQATHSCYRFTVVPLSHSITARGCRERCLQRRPGLHTI
jgi:hexosaminidase